MVTIVAENGDYTRPKRWQFFTDFGDCIRHSRLL